MMFHTGHLYFRMKGAGLGQLHCDMYVSLLRASYYNELLKRRTRA